LNYCSVLLLNVPGVQHLTVSPRALKSLLEPESQPEEACASDKTLHSHAHA